MVLNAVSVVLAYKLYDYAEYMEDHKAKGVYKVSKGQIVSFTPGSCTGIARRTSSPAKLHNVQSLSSYLCPEHKELTGEHEPRRSQANATAGLELQLTDVAVSSNCIGCGNVDGMG